MDIKIPRVAKFDELGPMTCDYLDNIVSGKSVEIELHIALSGNGHYLTIAARNHGNKKFVGHPPTLSANETAKKVNEYLLVCGTDPDRLTHEELFSFQKALYERHGLEFFLGDETEFGKVLFGVNDKLLAALFVQFDPKLVTE